MFLHGETVTRLRARALVDPYSNEPEDADWSTPDALDIPGCAVAPGGSAEPTQDARGAVDSDFDLIFKQTPDITASDRVVVRGLTCQVDGRPIQWRSPFTGWEAGWVVRASVREG